MEAFDLVFDDDDYLLELETEQQASTTPQLPPSAAAHNLSKNEEGNTKNQSELKDGKAEHSNPSNSFK